MTLANSTLAEPDATTAAAQRCVLVVEDEPFLAQLIDDALTTAGYRVLKASRMDTALAVVAGGQAIDAALLDVDLNGVEVFPLALKLRDLGVPFVFASGYGREALPPAFANFPVVQKPYLPDSLKLALARSLMDGNPPG